MRKARTATNMRCTTLTLDLSAAESDLPLASLVPLLSVASSCVHASV